MRRFVLVALALVMCLPFGWSQSNAVFASPDLVPPFVEGKVVVVFRNDLAEGFSKSATAEFESRHQTSIVKELGSLRYFATTVCTVSVPSGAETFQFIAELNRDSQVVYAEPNWRGEGQAWPNDSWFSPNGSPSTVMNVTEEGVEGTRQSATKQSIAVLDSGIDFTLADMAGRINTEYSRNFVTEGASAQDDNGHGSAMSSQIAAIAGNGFQLAGSSFYANVDIISVKVLGADKKGTYEDLLEGLLYVSEIAELDPSLRIVNLSLGGYGGGMAMSDALAQLATQDIVVSASAGNFAEDNDLHPSYPGALSVMLPNVLCVGALSSDGSAIAGFSNFGANSVSFYAPGSGTAIYPGGQQVVMSGTSSSAAYTSAMLAVVRGRHPDYSFWEARQQVVQTLAPREFLLGRCVTGGVLDMHAIVTQSPDLPATDQFVAKKVTWTSKNGGQLKVTVECDPAAMISVIGYNPITKIKKNGQRVLTLNGFPSPPKGQTVTIILVSSLGDIELVSFRRTGKIVSLVETSTGKAETTSRPFLFML